MRRGCNNRMSRRDEWIVLGSSLFTVFVSFFAVIAR